MLEMQLGTSEIKVYNLWLPKFLNVYPQIRINQRDSIPLRAWISNVVLEER